LREVGIGFACFLMQCLGACPFLRGRQRNVDELRVDAVPVAESYLDTHVLRADTADVPVSHSHLNDQLRVKPVARLMRITSRVADHICLPDGVPEAVMNVAVYPDGRATALHQVVKIADERVVERAGIGIPWMDTAQGRRMMGHHDSFGIWRAI